MTKREQWMVTVFRKRESDASAEALFVDEYKGWNKDLDDNPGNVDRYYVNNFVNYFVYVTGVLPPSGTFIVPIHTGYVVHAQVLKSSTAKKLSEWAHIRPSTYIEALFGHDEEIMENLRGMSFEAFKAINTPLQRDLNKMDEMEAEWYAWHKKFLDTMPPEE